MGTAMVLPGRADMAAVSYTHLVGDALAIYDQYYQMLKVGE